MTASCRWDNDHIENLMRPRAMGRKAWLFCGSELAGQRAAVVMSLVGSAKLNGHDPRAYLKDVLTRLPTQMNSRFGQDGGFPTCQARLIRLDIERNAHGFDELARRAWT